MDKENSVDVSIAELADVVQIDPQKLLEQINNAGISKHSISDIINDEEKKDLLTYLKSSAKSSEPRKITLQRKTTSSLRIAGSKSISVEVRNKKIHYPSREHSSEVALDEETSSLLAFGSDRGEGSAKADRWSKLSSIEIKNFKAIDSLTVPLADVTILVGPNGSGKSSVLQAIHWAARAASYIEPKKQSEIISFDRLDYSPSSEPLKTATRVS